MTTSEFGIRVTVRIGFVPPPCAFDDFVHVRELRHPAEFLANLIAGRNKHGGIAGTARPDVCADCSTRYLACSIDNLLDRKAFTIAQIVKAAATVESAQRQNMRLREINDVDIIAHASPVTCRVVFAENGDLLALAERDLENERDQVELRVVIFTPCGRCAGGIKVAKACEAKAINSVEPVQNALEDEFRFTVWAAWDDRLGLVDRHPLGLGKQIRRGG